eukprot:gene7745-8556_t
MSFSEASPSPDQLHGHLHNRNEWSQLVGQEGFIVAEIIQKERPELQVVTVPHNAMTTMDYRADRVRIFVNASGKVVRPPRIG